MTRLWWISLVLFNLAFSSVQAASRVVTLDVKSTTETALSRSSNWGEMLPRTRAAGASISFSFLGSGVNVTLHAFQTYGIVEIELDGQKTQVDTFLPVGEPVGNICALCLSTLEFGQHQVTITNIGPSSETTTKRSWLYISNLSYITDDDPASSSSLPSTTSPPSTSDIHNTASATPSVASSDAPNNAHTGSHTTDDKPASSPSSPPATSFPSTNGTPDTASPGHSTTSSDAPNNVGQSSSSRASTGVIGGAVAGCLAAVSILLVGLWMILRRRRRPVPSSGSQRSRAIDIPSIRQPLEDDEPKPYTIPMFASAHESTPSPIMEKRRRILVLQNQLDLPLTARPTTSVEPEVTSTLAARSPPASSHDAPSTTTTELRDEVRQLREMVTQLTSPPKYDQS